MMWIEATVLLPPSARVQRTPRVLLQLRAATTPRVKAAAARSAAAGMLLVFLQGCRISAATPKLFLEYLCSSSPSCVADCSSNVAPVLQQVSTGAVNSAQHSWHPGQTGAGIGFEQCHPQETECVFQWGILDKSYEPQIDSLYCTFHFSYRFLICCQIWQDNVWWCFCFLFQPKLLFTTPLKATLYKCVQKTQCGAACSSHFQQENSSIFHFI